VIRAFAIGALLVVANIGCSLGDEVKVNQVNKSFDPGAVTIKAGDTIDFANGDTIAHNVYTRGSPQDFSLGTMKPGADKKVTFSAPGSYDVKCAIHPGMKMTVTVQ
jgi:plastocyanin